MTVIFMLNPSSFEFPDFPPRAPSVEAGLYAKIFKAKTMFFNIFLL